VHGVLESDRLAGASDSSRTICVLVVMNGTLEIEPAGLFAFYGGSETPPLQKSPLVYEASRAPLELRVAHLQSDQVMVTLNPSEN
jgi:hypothetical protein